MRTATTPTRYAAIPCSRWRSIFRHRIANCVRSRRSRDWKTCQMPARCCAWAAPWSISIASPFGRFPNGSFSILTIPLTPCTASSNCGSSMRITMSTVFSRLSCSTATAVSSPPFFAPPSGRAAWKYAPSCVAYCAPSAPTGPGRKSCCAATVIIVVPRFSTFVAPTGSITSSASRRPRPYASMSRAWRPRQNRFTRPRRRTGRRAVSRSFTSHELKPGRANHRARRGGRGGPRHALRRHQAQCPRALRRLLLPARPSRKSHQVVEDASGGGPHLLHQGHGEPVAVVSARGRLLDHVGLACVDAEKIDMARRAIRHVALAPDQDRRARCRDEDDDPRALADILPGTGYFALRTRSNPAPRHVTSGAERPENRTLPC